MKHLNITFLLAVLLSMVSIKANAYDCKIDGICYDLDSATKRAKVVSCEGFVAGYTGHISIPMSITNNGTNYQITTIASAAFKDCTSMLSIIIPNSITRIEDKAFEYCKGLTTITIPNSVIRIVGSPFSGCDNLTSMTIEDGEEPLGFTNYFLFEVPIKTLYLGRKATFFDASYHAFGTPLYGMKTLTSLTIGNTVSNIDNNAFLGCNNLSILRIEDGEKVLVVNSAFYSCPLETLYIGRNISSTGSPFENQSKLSSVTFGHNVTSLPSNTFSGCNNLTTAIFENEKLGSWIKGRNSVTKVVVKNTVKTAESSAFNGCTGLTSVYITDISAWCNISFPNASSNPLYYAHHLYWNEEEIRDLIIPTSITSIGKYAFCSCSSLNSMTIHKSIESIDKSAFQDCNNLSLVNINNDNIVAKTYKSSSSIKDLFGSQVKKYVLGQEVKSVGDYAFYGCQNLRSIELGENIVSIGYNALSGCSGLTSLTIPNNVTEIGSSAFSGCSGLTSITIPSNVSSIGSSAFYGCTGLSAVTFKCKEIGSWISGMKSVTKVVIENSVTSIGSSAFKDCSGLTSLTLPNSITSIGSSAFQGCSGLTSMTIPDNVTEIGKSAFQGCSGMTSLVIGKGGTSIGSSAFSGCVGLTSVSLPESIASISENLFYGCTKLASVTLPDNVVSFGYRAFPSDCKLYVKKGTKSLLALWEANGYTPYDKSTNKEILPPLLNVAQTTQTTAMVKIDNMYDGYTYLYNGEKTDKSEFKYTKLKPESTQNLTLKVSLDDVSYETSGRFTTKGLSPRIEGYFSTASSISATGAYTEEDAKVLAESISVGWKSSSLNGNQCFVSGLNPGRSYEVRYQIEVDYGGTETAFYTGTKSVYTAYLRFNTAAAKIVSLGNAIVSATTNLDENEENVGFEWRCVDWTNEFPSNTGTAYLFDGTIEGYIRELNTDKLWKYRPYYLSNDGTYHYGDWIGLDPTNTSYFEPTVHTYSKVTVQGNTALVRGYALSGTDDVAVRGFKYWRTRTGGHAQTRATSVPDDAATVEANGQQTMSANLTGLEYGSTYHYAAFATTSKGETFYGEEQMFTTPLAGAKYATFYDSQTAYILPTGLSASVVIGVSNGKLTYETIAEGGKSNRVLPKGVAVMLTSAKDQPSSYTLTPTESDATYTGTNLLRGSDVATTTTGDGSCWFYKLSYGASDTEWSGVFGWYWGASNGGAFKIEGHKAWLAVPKSAGSPTRAFGMDGEMMDRVEVETSVEKEDGMYYDLSGRPVRKPLSKGVYIYQGRKVFIK